MPIHAGRILISTGQIRRSMAGAEYARNALMARKSVLFVAILTLSIGCTSDPMGLRSTYRDRVVPPTSNSRPVSNSPVAVQPGSLTTPGSVALGAVPGQVATLPTASISNPAMALGSSARPSQPYPMLASSARDVDGRSYPFLTREVRIPRRGGARHRNQAVRTTAASNGAITGGIAPSPQEDLKYRGGRTIRDLKYINIYVGGSEAWDAGDWKNIDKYLAAAMSDRKLNNVLVQYFDNKPVSSQFLGSFFMSGWKPKLVEKNDLEAKIQGLYRQGAFNGLDFPNTVVNMILPRGTILGDPSGGQQSTVTNKAIPEAEAEDSTGGLGGYHGSAHIAGKTIYYAVGVYSERLPNGGTNGIPVFDQNWKNVIGTFYHELQEARTDPDVDDAATDPNGMRLLGWTSDSGQEIGDYPIAEATQLLQVFKEVPLADGSGTVPVQLCYSNAVHGPEGPIDYPHGMEPPPGTTPVDNSPPPKNPGNPPPSSTGLPANLPPKVQKMVTDWDQLEDYVKKAILKLLS
jgi:hypothetical protein